MKFIFLVIILFSLSLISCYRNRSEQQRNLVDTEPVFLSETTYQFSRFGSEDLCKANKKENPVVNCYQYVTFGTDGGAFVILTDMPNIGTYAIDNNKVTVSFAIVSDSPKEMMFTLSLDKLNLKNDLDGKIWTLKQ